MNITQKSFQNDINPFLYIHNDTDFNVLLMNIRNLVFETDYPYKKHMLRFIWLIFRFICTFLNETDQNLNSVYKLLNAALPDSRQVDVNSTFSYLLENANNDLFYCYKECFINSVFGINSSIYKCIVRNTKDFFDKTELKNLVCHLSLQKQNPESELLQSEEYLYISSLFDECKPIEGLSEKELKKLEELSAIHEAGHAVICWLFDVPILGVSIEPNNKSLGRIAKESAETIFQEILIDYAGFAAEIIFSLFYDYGLEPGNGDIQKATESVKELVTIDIHELLRVNKYFFIDFETIGLSNFKDSYIFLETARQCEFYFNETVSLLIPYQSVIRELADLLLKKRTLDDEAIYIFLEKYEI